MGGCVESYTVSCCVWIINKDIEKRQIVLNEDDISDSIVSDISTIYSNEVIWGVGGK